MTGQRPLADDRDGSLFPFQIRLGLRHTDLDAQKVVSNVALAELYEDARTRFSVSRRLKPAFDPNRRLLTGVEIVFGADAAYPGDIDMALGVAQLDQRSWTVRAIASQNGTYIAGCDSRFSLVLDDREVDLPGMLRDILQQDLIGRR